MTLKFGTAGVRGIYGQQLQVGNIAQLVGALSQAMGKGGYGVGYDTRKASKTLANTAEAVLTWTGHKTIDLGQVPTPAVAFAAKHLKLNASMAFTASHNPPDYVGVKIFTSNGLEASKELETRIEQGIGSMLIQPSRYGSTIKKHWIIEEYLERIISMVPKTKRKLRILIDCANGAGSTVTPLLLHRLGHKVITVNSHPSWRFPGRVIEPRAENLVETTNMIKHLDVDLGFGHDGDADRLVVIDNSGNVIPDNIFSAMMLKFIAKGKKGDVVISSNSSLAVEEMGQMVGCKVIRAPLGKTPHELHLRNGIYATEPSKIVDPQWGLWEDGIYAAALLTQIISSLPRGLAEALNGVPRYQYIQKDLFGSMPKSLLSQIVKNCYSERGRFEEVEGVRVIMRDKWIMFRTSGTEPKIRIYTEAKQDKEATRLMEEGKRLLLFHMKHS